MYDFLTDTDLPLIIIIIITCFIDSLDSLEIDELLIVKKKDKITVVEEGNTSCR